MILEHSYLECAALLHVVKRVHHVLRKRCCRTATTTLRNAPDRLALVRVGVALDSRIERMGPLLEAACGEQRHRELPHEILSAAILGRTLLAMVYGRIGRAHFGRLAHRGHGRHEELARGPEQPRLDGIELQVELLERGAAHEAAGQ